MYVTSANSAHFFNREKGATSNRIMIMKRMGIVRSIFTLLLFFLPSFSSMSNKLLDIANMALQNSPSTNRFITNKMCPFAQKAWIALEASNTPYEMEEVSLYGSGGKPDWFWDLNPKGTVPVLVMGGGAMVLADSDLILDQFEKGQKPPGVTSMYSEKDEDKIRTWRKRVNGMLPVGKKAVQGGSTTALKDKLKQMDNEIVGPYLVGDYISTADCHAFPFLWRLRTEYGLDEYENLDRWVKHCAQQMPFKKTIQNNWWWWW